MVAAAAMGHMETKVDRNETLQTEGPDYTHVYEHKKETGGALGDESWWDQIRIKAKTDASSRWCPDRGACPPRAYLA